MNPVSSTGRRIDIGAHPAFAPFFGRLDPAQTLKVHRFCARATRLLSWCIASGVTVAWLGGVLILVHAADVDVPHPMQVVVLTLCIAAYAACFTLWRCYEASLRTIHTLCTQPCDSAVSSGANVVRIDSIRRRP